jgi:transaldolase
VPKDFFRRLVAETPTRAWVNNPTVEEIGLALEQGAVAATTNPAYGGNLLRRAPEQILPIIEECARESDDATVVADQVQRRLVRRIADRFLPIYESSGGHLGLVSIQGAPENDTKAENILRAARADHAVIPNATPKIPATAPGLDAFEILVAEGYATLVTEVFSVAQLIETGERYLRVTSRTGKRPPLYVCPITGIFGDHLKALCKRQGIEASSSDMELAGVAWAREAYRVAREREYPMTLLAGGSRIPLDLTGLVGAAMHATINWSTFAEVIADPAPFAPGIDEPLDAAALRRLDATFSDFRKAMRPDGLALDEFESYGPVQQFRNNFISGWTQVQEAVAAEMAKKR